MGDEISWNTELFVVAHKQYTEIRFPGHSEPILLRPGESWRGQMHADLRGERAKAITTAARAISKAAS